MTDIMINYNLITHCTVNLITLNFYLLIFKFPLKWNKENFYFSWIETENWIYYEYYLIN